MRSVVTEEFLVETLKTNNVYKSKTFQQQSIACHYVNTTHNTPLADLDIYVENGKKKRASQEDASVAKRFMQLHSALQRATWPNQPWRHTAW